MPNSISAQAESNQLSGFPTSCTHTVPTLFTEIPTCCTNGNCPSRRLDGTKLPSPLIGKGGSYWRKCDQQKVPRFLCKACGTRFSPATGSPDFAQKKRYINNDVRTLLCSGVSMRRCALLLKVTRITINRKLLYWSEESQIRNGNQLLQQDEIAFVQFDEMETFEHTKYKPLAIALAVNSRNRQILGIEVNSMPPKKKLDEKALKKYGERENKRPEGIRNLLETIKPFLTKNAELYSDKCPIYPKIVQEVFDEDPNFEITHKQTLGGRSSIVGQGELKQKEFDPIFALNHTAAMIRDNVGRLVRRSWKISKRAVYLAHHLHVYIAYHNEMLIHKKLMQIGENGCF
jgi:transposase-like protein